MNVNQSIIISVMKKISTLIAFIVCCMMAFGQGVHFDDLTLDEALAKAKAETEFEKYRVIQDRLFMSDFDKYMLELEENAKK